MTSKATVTPITSRKAANSGGSNYAIGGISCDTRWMKTSDFLSVPRSKFQRDEAIRAAKHLKSPSIAHITGFAMLRGINGECVKLDGHTRAYLHENGNLRLTEEIEVCVFQIVDPSIDFDEVQEVLYDTFNSRQALKTPKDEIQGAMNKNDLVLKTKWLREGGYSSLMNCAAKFISTLSSSTTVENKKKLVGHFTDALRAIDAIEPDQYWMPIGFGAGVLMFYEEFGDKGVETIRGYLTGRGSNEEDGQKNYIAQLRDFRRAESLKGRMGTNDNNMRQARTAYCYLKSAFKHPDRMGKTPCKFNQKTYDNALAKKR